MAIYLGVFLITLSGLIFEIGLTRIYSATIWYHFAFVAISVALLGWGLGGIVLHLVKRWVTPTLDKAAACCRCCTRSAIPLALWVHRARFRSELERLALYFITPLLPFFLAGMALSMVFRPERRDDRGVAVLRRSAWRVARRAGRDVPAAVARRRGDAVLVAASCRSLAAAVLSPPRGAAGAGRRGRPRRRRRWPTNARELFRVTPGEIKAMHRHMTRTRARTSTQTGWNAYSRIDAVEGFAPPYLARLYIDSDAWTNVLQWDGNLEDVRGLQRLVPRAAVPADAEQPKTLVIGPGGGSDVLVGARVGQPEGDGRRAQSADAPVRAPLRRARGQHLRPAGRGGRPERRAQRSSAGRDRKFDVILLGFVDSWASVASGGLSLSENYLYTIAGVPRLLRPPDRRRRARRSCAGTSDIPRLVSNSVALLGAERGGQARRRADREAASAATDDPPQMIFMLRKRPFTPEETRGSSTTGRSPRRSSSRAARPRAPYDDLLTGRKTHGASTPAESPRRVEPVFDDSPFYFAVEKPWGMPPGIASADCSALLAPVARAAACCSSRSASRAASASAPYAASVVYFACARRRASSPSSWRCCRT